MAEALCGWLADHGVAAQPTPVPDDLMARLPLCVLGTLGGQRTWPVLDSHRLQADCYGETMADALECARMAFAAIDLINDEHPVIAGAQTYRAELGGLPAESDDPKHEDAPVATFICQVTCRAHET